MPQNPIKQGVVTCRQGTLACHFLGQKPLLVERQATRPRWFACREVAALFYSQRRSCFLKVVELGQYFVLKLKGGQVPPVPLADDGVSTVNEVQVLEDVGNRAASGEFGLFELTKRRLFTVAFAKCRRQPDQNVSLIFHIFQFVFVVEVSLFNSHFLTLQYTKNVYWSTTIFNFFTMQKPNKINSSDGYLPSGDSHLS